MSQEEIIATLKKILVTDLFVEIPEQNIGPDDGLQSVLGLDSVGFLELRVLSEKRFQVQIPDEALSAEHFNSVRSVANLVQSLRSQGRA
ncbi:acyl carrier protein [Vitiosangium sp. GDMCC 1.1324]|uniref:acyl carrier protein n=1 Tax=Vitiosangium sp. (strain GDMCC 1.1324) TaxID=2138576 RepID=UPI000D331730|nr:acyl carrier protein [Vitiosangium sp. GDMCC 1.1324]PTL80872.1 coronafacic acid synthetase [Vitiosangium sp. GDMCC 1.1324]